MYSVEVFTALKANASPTFMMTLPPPGPNSPIASGTFTTALPGGFAGATINFKPGFRRPIPQNAHMAVIASGGLGGVVFEGRAVRQTYAGRDLQKVELQGYGVVGMGDDIVVAADTQDPMDASLCLSTAISTAAPLLSQGPTWQKTGVSHVMSLFNNQTPFQVAQRIQSESSYDFACWEKRQCNLIARTAPTRPDYQVPEQDCNSWESDAGSIWTEVLVNYTDSSSKTTTSYDWTDTSAESLQNIHRRTAVAGGTLDLPGAIAYAQNYVAQHNAPVVRVQVGPVASLRTPEGSAIPGYRVRAGQWLRVQNRTPDQIIVQTSCDWSGAVTVQAGQLARDDVGTMATLTTLAVAFMKGINPNTGAAA